MILPDLNLILHAYNTQSPVHGAARRWWEECLSGTASTGLAWAVILGFIRITTHPRILDNPLPVEKACSHARAWLGRPQVILIHPGERHGEILFDLLAHVGTGGNLTTDAHLAALAIEHQADLYTTDADFARFPGLRWHHPLRKK